MARLPASNEEGEVQTTVIFIPTADIIDWDTFHDVFEKALGFPGFYGRNMDAWIDCMTYADDPDSDMITPSVQPGELLTLRLADAATFKKRCPDQYEALIECTAFVNYRRVERGDEPVLSLLVEGYF
ncbi:MAG: barstar family protein [Sphingomonas bacterium]